MGTSGVLFILPIFDISFLVGRTMLEVSVSVFLCPVNERSEATHCPQLHSKPVLPEDQCYSSSQLSEAHRERRDSSGLALEPTSLTLRHCITAGNGV